MFNYGRLSTSRCKQISGRQRLGKKVISFGLHSPNPDYKQIFINLAADKYDTKESIWEVEFMFDPALVHLNMVTLDTLMA